MTSTQTLDASTFRCQDSGAPLRWNDRRCHDCGEAAIADAKRKAADAKQTAARIFDMQVARWL